LVPQPEQEARSNIDALLTAAGWHVCDASSANIYVAQPGHVWLKDDSLSDSDNLPAPNVIAAEIVEDLKAAKGQSLHHPSRNSS
jgi:hypothetical protein